MWVQLLAAVLLALLLAGPRWVAPLDAQRVVILLDDTASMSAFRDAAGERLESIAADADERARVTEWVLLTFSGSRLYAGDSIEDLVAALEGWEPSRSAEDLSDSLALARSIAGASGLIFALSDHPAPDEQFKLWNSVGEPIGNVGISGILAGPDGWSAVIRNYGSDPVERSWRVRPDSLADAEWETISLPPGGARTVTGRFPSDGGEIWVELSPDRFVLDDRAPIVPPAPKPISVQAGGGAPEELGAKIVALFEDRPASRAEPDIVIDSWSPLRPGFPEGNAILFIAEAGERAKAIEGMPVATRQPLVEGLDWGPLVAATAFDFPESVVGNVLVWAGDRPLISERKTADGSQLLFHFDPRASNLARLPAFPVLVHRWVESVAHGLARPIAGNFETGQRIDEQASLPLARAPLEPGFFGVPDEGEQPLIIGAAQFSDTREADFSGASTVTQLSSDSGADLIREARAQAPGALLGLILGGVILGSWYLVSKEA